MAETISDVVQDVIRTAWQEGARCERHAWGQEWAAEWAAQVQQRLLAAVLPRLEAAILPRATVWHREVAQMLVEELTALQAEGRVLPWSTVHGRLAVCRAWGHQLARGNPWGQHEPTQERQTLLAEMLLEDVTALMEKGQSVSWPGIEGILVALCGYAERLAMDTGGHNGTP